MSTQMIVFVLSLRFSYLRRSGQFNLFCISLVFLVMKIRWKKQSNFLNLFNLFIFIFYQFFSYCCLLNIIYEINISMIIEKYVKKIDNLSLCCQFFKTKELNCYKIKITKGHITKELLFSSTKLIFTSYLPIIYLHSGEISCCSTSLMLNQ